MFSLRVCFKSLICSVSLTFTMDIRLSSCQYIKVVPLLGCDLNSGLTPQRALSSLGSCPSHSYHPGANVTVFFLWLLFLDNVDNSKYCGCTKNTFPHCNCCSDFKEVSYKGIIVSSTTGRNIS